ncbi:MAG: putative DNA modification/repair radical SAM protein [Clostridia bacterium]
MELMEKLEILADSAKYDVSCSSSGSRRKNEGIIGSATPAGCCHSFSEDGRCISLFKVLFTNYCINDCKYCQCRASNDIKRAAFTPRELADLFIGFYKRNYVEGLFLSSGIVKSPDYTAQLLLETLTIIRKEYGFSGYVHVKAIPGADKALIYALGLMADRMSANIELPSEKSLQLLAPQKTREKVLSPIRQIQAGIINNKNELTLYKHAPRFVPGGQSTQMIVGATSDSDYRIIKLTEGLYDKFSLKRVYYSAYIPLGNHPMLPKTSPPLLREHRLYQADWLLRFYGFKADEILTEDKPFLDTLLDPKCNWAMNNLQLFPVEVNKAPYEILLRVPGIGVKSARRIVTARRGVKLDFPALKRLGVVLKRAAYFITCDGKYMYSALKMNENFIYSSLTASLPPEAVENPSQISLFPQIERREKLLCMTGEM